ncbi:hypothetical protein B0T21DRAFT_47968 [Apiosordaria backusii]|uniref:Uncharacterized protein n=1 Tax=Apiosordaria backusii TaxID=314023 RepID=A0AA40AXT4_9PEZI|nr:hypothetical protein B0T21DRAFT_47968 [Apiosordaria backusii]
MNLSRDEIWCLLLLAFVLRCPGDLVQIKIDNRGSLSHSKHPLVCPRKATRGLLRRQLVPCLSSCKRSHGSRHLFASDSADEASQRQTYPATSLIPRRTSPQGNQGEQMRPLGVPARVSKALFKSWIPPLIGPSPKLTVQKAIGGCLPSGEPSQAREIRLYILAYFTQRQSQISTRGYNKSLSRVEGRGIIRLKRNTLPSETETNSGSLVSNQPPLNADADGMSAAACFEGG